VLQDNIGQSLDKVDLLEVETTLDTSPSTTVIDSVASAKRESSLSKWHCLKRRPVTIMKEGSEMSKNE
jgi:hypothetical protein